MPALAGGFIWNHYQQSVFIWGMHQSQGLWMELHSRTLNDSHQALSSRPFTWKEARLSLSNSLKRGPHTSCRLKFFSPTDNATQSRALSKIGSIRAMRTGTQSSMFTVARDGKTPPFYAVQCFNFSLKYNTERRWTKKKHIARRGLHSPEWTFALGSDSSGWTRKPSQTQERRTQLNNFFVWPLPPAWTRAGSHQLGRADWVRTSQPHIQRPCTGSWS